MTTGGRMTTPVGPTRPLWSCLCSSSLLRGGPSLKQCFGPIRNVSSAPVLDLRHLLDAVVFNWLVGNNDAHGKNFSLLYTGMGTGRVETRLAPLYDMVATVAYPELSGEMPWDR